ncbi:MAG: DUF177 domain-containing protein [Rhodothermales bacterium]
MFRDISLHVRLDVQPDNVYVRITARGTARLICDRTVVPYDEAVSGDYAMLFVTRGAMDAQDDTMDDVVDLAPDEDEIDITEPVRDTLLLALPQRRVAPGADDEELPLQFGAPADPEENHDPRWDALRTLRGDEPVS